jgi:hypothetical protein
MRIARSWNAERILREWTALKDAPATERDFGGDPSNPLRLRMPPWMLCEDADITQDCNYEKHEVTESTRPRNVSEEVGAQMNVDRQKGFGHVPGIDREMMSEVTAASASNETGLTILNAAYRTLEGKPRSSTSIDESTPLQNKRPAELLEPASSGRKKQKPSLNFDVKDLDNLALSFVL